MVSKRAQKVLGDPPPIVKAHIICAKDSYDAKTNPDGYINLGVAENFLMDAEITIKIAELSKKPFYHHYNYPQGSPELRSAYLGFLDFFFKIKNIPPENIVFASGASAILEMLTYALCDEGDEILVPSPLYNGFYHDVELRFGAKIITSDCITISGFNLKIFESSIKENKNLKAVLINHPHNPTGQTLNETEIRSIIEICKKYELDIIADEIYANSVYGEADFISFLDPRFDDLNYLNNIHHVFGLAKDFGMSGLKTGIFASHNINLSKAMAAVSYFYTVSTQTQSLAQGLFEDIHWCEKFFKVNRQRLKEVSTYVYEYFKKAGAEVFPGTSGIFLWVDLSHLSSIKTFEDESRFFEQLMTQEKINLTPGKPFGSNKPGTFRVCFAKPIDLIKVAFKRFDKIK